MKIRSENYVNFLLCGLMLAFAARPLLAGAGETRSFGEKGVLSLTALSFHASQSDSASSGKLASGVSHWRAIARENPDFGCFRPEPSTLVFSEVPRENLALYPSGLSFSPLKPLVLRI